MKTEQNKCVKKAKIAAWIFYGSLYVVLVWLCPLLADRTDMILLFHTIIAFVVFGTIFWAIVGILFTLGVNIHDSINGKDILMLNPLKLYKEMMDNLSSGSGYSNM